MTQREPVRLLKYSLCSSRFPSTRVGEVSKSFWGAGEKTTEVGTFWSHALSMHSLASLHRSRKENDCYVGYEIQDKKFNV